MAYHKDDGKEPKKFNLSLDTLLTSQNIAKELTKDQLKCIEQDLSCEIKADISSREAWEQDIEEWTNLAAQVREDKNWPWENASNIKYPILTIASMQFAARAYPALVTNPDFVSSRVNGFDPDGKKAKRGKRVSKHMSFQMRHQMKAWEEHMDRLLHVLPIVGTAFKKTYFDPIEQQNVSEFVPAQELVINYHASSMEDAERKTHILYYTKNQVHEQIAAGLFLKPEKKLTSLKEDRKVNQSKTQNQKNTKDESVSELYECHCCYDLDGDGYAEPYIITMHAPTMQVLRIYRRFDENSVLYNEMGDIMKIVPTEYFTSYIFIPDPNSGVYGLGFGALLGPLNVSINSLINMLVDSGTLNNMQGGFLASSFQLESGDMTWEPGEWKVVNSFGNDIRQGIVPLPTQPPSNVLFNLLNMLEAASLKIASVTDILTGEIPGQNTKATVIMQAVEQGLKVYSSIYRRCHKALSKELQKIAKLNANFLDDQVYVAVLDMEQDGDVKVTREDYLMDDFDITLSADPNVSSSAQRLAKLQALMEILPLGHVNPQVVTMQWLEETEQKDIEMLMKMPPPPGPPLELQIKQAEVQHKIQKEGVELNHRILMDKYDLHLRAIDMDQRAIENNTQALLNIAKAESEEAGAQLAEYRAYLEEVRKQEDQLMKKRSQVFQEKLQAMEMEMARKEQAEAEAAAQAQAQQAQGSAPQ